MNYIIKINIVIFTLLVFQFINFNHSIAGNIINCPTCNLDRNFCKNCVSKPKNKKSSSSKVKKKNPTNNNFKNDLNLNTDKNKLSLKTKDAEDKCSELGFSKGTEKYGECVLKLLDLN